MSEQSAEHKCGLCGEPMPPGEEMFAYHGFSGSCPKPSNAEPSEPEQPALARELKSHLSHILGVTEPLRITARDAPGLGGANYHYDITGFDTGNNPSVPTDGYKSSFSRLPVIFQNGPIAAVGLNGVTHEALLAIVQDRLTAFQAGEFACDENESALRHVTSALQFLKTRTAKRVARGVEGTLQK